MALNINDNKRGWLCACLFTLLLGSPAMATPIAVDFGPANIVEPGFSGGNTLSIPIAVPTSITHLVGFTLTVEGDLDAADESVDIELDGLLLGTLFNDNPADDPFDFNGATDVGSIDPLIGNAFPALDVSSIVNDGAIVLSFLTSAGVDAPEAVNSPFFFPGLTGQFAAFGTLRFDTRPTDVPLPGTAVLMLLGISCLASARRRR